MASKKINFAAINAAALSQFESLLRDWLPDGEKSGSEYRALNPTRGDSKKGSFSINIRKGVWQDFATDDAGSDPISLYAYLFCSDDQGAAARELAERLGIEVPNNTPKNQASKPDTHRLTRPGEKPGERAQSQSKKSTSDKPGGDSPWHPLIPVPASAPERHQAHPVRGMPETVWTYNGLGGELLGYVFRFAKSDGGKEIAPLTWCRNEKSGACDWRWMQWAEPRPLYGLDRLTVADVDAGGHKATVLLVEGEKCADAAAAHLPDLAVLTWSGGSKAVDKADWSALAGRKVILWPDCDSQRAKKPKDAPADFVPDYLPPEKQPGLTAMRKIAEKLQALGCKVWLMDIPAIGSKPNGWDVADAIAEGLRGADLAAYVRNQAKLLEPASMPQPAEPVCTPVPVGTGGGGSGDVPPASNDDEKNPDRAWYYALAKKTRGGIEPCRSNVAKILRMHPAWRGRLGYNEFAHQIERLLPVPWNDEPGVWDGADDSSLDEWLADEVDVLIKAMSTIAEGVSHAANANRFHPVKQFLEGLPPWDGTPRLNCFLADITDNENSKFIELAGRFFIMAMVARIFKPGVKFDYMLVLEGKQGQGKSSFFRTLAEPWFSETPFDIGTNEGNMAIQGVWLQEMPEMGMFTRSEDTAFKSFLAIVKDKFRRPYDRRPVDAPRVCVFGGTTNLDVYLKDQTGNRRIWPVRCAEVNVDYLAEIREQLFAEAILAFKAGERFYPTREEEALYFEPEQRNRLSVDGWEELIVQYLNDPTERLRNFYTSVDILINACKVEKSKIDEGNRMTTRVGRIMRKIGWERDREPSGPDRKWGYIRPEKDRVRKEIFGDPIND